MPPDTHSHRPEALLFVAPGCPHCPTVLEGLSRLIKEAVLSRLEVVNVAASPERARELGVRAVPWLRLGEFHFEGLMSPGELREWAERSGSREGMTAYFNHLLTTARRRTVEDILRHSPEHLQSLVALMAAPETGIHARLGIAATLEELQDTDILVDLVEPLGGLSRSPEVRIRADACHALSLSGSPEAIPYLEACLEDADPQVREAAQDAIEELRAKLGQHP